MTTLTKPTKQTIAYRAAVLIFEHGPMERADLFSRIDFGSKPGVKLDNLAAAMEQGWLEQNAAGQIDITQSAFSLLEREEKRKNEPPTSVATSRQINVYERPHYVSPRRVIRQDAPPLYPAGFHFRTIAG